MKESLKLTLPRDELQKLLEKYYKEQYSDDHIEIVFEKEKVEGDYPFQGSYICTHFKLKRNLKIGNYSAALEQVLEESDIEEVIRKELENTDYDVEDIRQHDIDFSSINIKVKRKQNQRIYRK